MDIKFISSEFERDVRKILNIYDRPITEQDVLTIDELDLTNFYFNPDDLEALACFKNLKYLDIEMINTNFDFWNHFPQLVQLYWVCWGNDVDFGMFSNMHELYELIVSGGDYSNIRLYNLEALIPLKKLEWLTLHEFGEVDLTPLGNMPQVKNLGVLYSHQVKNIDTIGKMSQLESLSLRGLLVNNLNFLDTVPSDIELELGGIEVLDSQSIDPSKWRRFSNRDIYEIQTKDEHWDYIDLSALDD